MSERKRHILFVCSKNQWRSPTAESLYRKHPMLEVRSAGTSTSGRRQVNADDIAWADIIFVMEDKHVIRLRAQHGDLLGSKILHVLDIPDEYKYMDPELVDLLLTSVNSILAVEP
jgi:predicted protein tyrosine phosphatase